MTWQPIETAPKDGTEILLYVGIMKHDYAVAHWNERYWQMGVHQDRFYSEFGQPTHWMPLPEAPK